MSPCAYPVKIDWSSRSLPDMHMWTTSIMNEEDQSSVANESGSEDSEAEGVIQNGKHMSLQAAATSDLQHMSAASVDFIKYLPSFTELSDIPLGELQALREKIGTKKFDIVLQKSREEKEKRSFKRVNKNRYSVYDDTNALLETTHVH